MITNLQGIYAEDLDGYPPIPKSDNYLSPELKYIGLAVANEARSEIENMNIGTEGTEGLEIFDLAAYDEELKKDAIASYATAGQYRIESTHQYKHNCECRSCVTDRLIDYGLPVKEALQLSYLQEKSNRNAA